MVSKNICIFGIYYPSLLTLLTKTIINSTGRRYHNTSHEKKNNVQDRDFNSHNATL